MAIINLTWENIDGILGEVHRVFNQEREPIMAEPIVPPAGVGDDLMSWLVPRDVNKKIVEAMPDWCKTAQKLIYLKVDIANESNEGSAFTPIIRLPLSEVWHRYPGTLTQVITNGVHYAGWDGQTLYLCLKDTESGLPQDRATDFVKQMFAIAQKHYEISKKASKAVETMREFLGQHRTLQTALKECPAIMSYVPDWMKQELNRVPPKRTRRPPIPKAEKKEVDMSQLVAQATISKLNL